MTDLAKKERQRVAGACIAVYDEWVFGHTAAEINSGLCEEYACKVVDRIAQTPGSANPGEVVVTGCEVDGCDPIGRWGGHVWVYNKETETHHDAEAPFGVEDWKELPFFNRQGS